MKSFAHWAGSWWLVPTIYGFIYGKAKEAWFMISPSGLIVLAILIGLGIPLALAFATVFCWFKNTDQEQDTG